MDYQAVHKYVVLRRRITLWASLLLILAGLFGIRTVYLITTSSVAPGVVTSVGGGEIGYHGRGRPAVVSFQDQQHRPHQLYTRTLPGHLYQGERVEVLYDAHDPDHTAQVYLLVRVWFFPGVFAIMGLMFFVIREPWLKRLQHADHA